MKKLVLCISTLAILAIACQKLENNVPLNGDEMAPAVKMITETISGSHGVETKATIANEGATFAWTSGDNVAVHVSSVSNVSNGKFVYTSDEGASGATPDTENPAKASFTVVYPADYSRDAFAVYPSTIVAEDGLPGSTLNVTLPPSYTLDQVQGEVSPCPMIADNTGASWSFSQLCSLLRLTVNNIPPSTKRLEIDFNGNKVCGAFSIANPEPGTSSIATIADEANDVITITNSGSTFYSGWGDGKVFNIPLPTGTYSNITVTAYDASVNGNAILTVTYPFAYTATNTKGKKLTVSLPVFSVSVDKRVLFSPGNLQASTSDCGEHWTWGFAAHEWDYVGNNTSHNSRISGNGTVKFSGAGSVDLFCWVGASNTTWSGALGTTLNAAMYGITNSQTMNSTETYGNGANESLKSDWGNTINDGYSWRTPTAEEWAYVLATRASGSAVNNVSDARYTLARINTDKTIVNGIILFPDGVTIKSGEATKWGNINTIIGTSSTFDTWDKATQCSSSEWIALAAKGCAFLPMAGDARTYSKSPSGQESTPVTNAGEQSGYWSSTPNNANKAYYVFIGRNNIYMYPEDDLTHSDRKLGHSVRLVRDIN